MNRLELFNILQPIVKSVTGVSIVILANQTQSDGTGIPAPSGEYITIEPKQSVAQRGQANIHHNTSTTPLSLDIFGNWGGTDKAYCLHICMCKKSINRFFITINHIEYTIGKACLSE